MYQLRKPNKQIDYIKQTFNCSMFIIINSINEIYFKENRNYKLNKKKSKNGCCRIRTYDLMDQHLTLAP